MERIAIAMQNGGAGAGAWHEAAERAARPTSFCLAAGPLYGTPGGGLFGFKFSSRPHPRKFAVKRFLVVRRLVVRKWGGLFWATSLEKIIDGVIAIISFRPGGWMQQSAVPRCAILSVGSTGGIGQ